MGISGLQTAEIPLRVEEGFLQMGQAHIPISTANHCWITLGNRLVVSCESKKGRFYKGIFELHLQSAEKVKECIRLILEKTRVKISFPLMSSIKPTSETITFKFAGKEDAEQFQYFYAPCFFPLESYECCLYRDSCVVIVKPDKEQNNQIALIKRILSDLNHRTYQHPIQSILQANKDPDFSIDTYPVEKPLFSPAHFQNKTQKTFQISYEGVQRIISDQNHERQLRSTTPNEVNFWIIDCLPEARLYDKEPWVKFLGELKKNQRQDFGNFISQIELILKAYDTSPKWDLEHLFQPLRELFEMDDEQLKTIIHNCFYTQTRE